jgi:glycosyltransferase involved in cell wall biosynthesis
LKVLHFLAEGRLCGPLVRLSRVHRELYRQYGNSIVAFVASPPLEPPDYLSREEIGHIEAVWSKPQREKPITTGLAWLTTGVFRDVIRARKIIRETGPSVVQVNGAILIAGVIAARLEGLPVMWLLNDCTVPRLFARTIKLIAGASGATLMAASRAVIDYYNLQKTTPIVFPPLPSSLPEPVSRKTVGRRLGTLANLSPGKGFETIIDACSLLRPEMPDLRFEIVGRILENKKWYYDKLRERALAKGVAESVHFVGFVQEPMAWLREIDVMVFCSESEASPGAVVEAMACGTPVVAADIPATREMLGDAGMLVEPGNFAQLASSIREILSNESLYHECVARGKKRSAELFSVDTVAAQYYDLYTALLSPSRTA